MSHPRFNHHPPPGDSYVHPSIVALEPIRGYGQTTTGCQPLTTRYVECCSRGLHEGNRSMGAPQPSRIPAYTHPPMLTPYLIVNTSRILHIYGAVEKFCTDITLYLIKYYMNMNNGNLTLSSCLAYNCLLLFRLQVSM